MLVSVFVLCLAFASLNDAARLGSRIVGGSDVDIENYPFVLSLRSHESHLCGAVIVSRNWAITAAQCVDGVTNFESVTLVVGSSLLSEGGKVHAVSQIFVHHDYDPVYKDYDIAVIKVKVPFDLGPNNERAVPLADEDVLDGDMAEVVGWGYTKMNGGALSDHLRSVQVPIISHEECITDFPKQPISLRMLCAGFAEGGKDSCDGDTGGPLLHDGRLLGIVSWGNGCALPNLPGVYTSVPALREWIRERTGA